jgi:hypothetical protein
MGGQGDIPVSQATRRAAVGKGRLVAAFVVAAVSDALSAWLTLLPAVQWGVDLVTAALLFLLLGRQWVILPGLIAEAIPGVALFPTWMLVVGSVAVWGRIGRTRV